MSNYIFKKMPSPDWQDALPLGNGHVGAMIHGNVQSEIILLNHEKLFRYQKEPVYDDFYPYLDKVRQLMLEGNYKQGEEYFNEKFLEVCKEVYNVDPYQPFGQVFINRRPLDAPKDYKAILDFEKALTSISWLEGEREIKRESFVSYDTGVVCTKISSSKEKTLDLDITIQAVEGGDDYMSYATYQKDKCLIYDATYKDQRKHGAIMYVDSSDGDISFTKDRIRVKNASEARVFVQLYIYEDLEQAHKRILEEIKKWDYNHLKNSHVNIWKSLYNKISFNLGPEDSEKMIPNEEYLYQAYLDKKPLKLFQLMFNYGRYLFISSSSKDGLPINLQGIWNGEYNPRWDSDIHNDENVQMCYWPAMALGQEESALALYDYFDSLIPHFQENAKKIYNCRGILIPICMSTHGKIGGKTGRWQSWVGGAGWIAAHYYDYWLYTKDQDFLKNRALPFMKEVALFYQDFLIKDKNGEYIFVPSMSPENIPNTKYPAMMAVNATMDIAIAKELLGNLIKSAKYLGLESENIGIWQEIIDNLPKYQINEDGALKEWIYEGLEDNYHHRHQSHIYPLFPGLEVTKENNPKIYEAIKKAVDKRLLVGFTQQTGWSYAHMANIYARLEDGEKAFDCLNYILRSCTGQNLFTYHNDWRDQGLTMYWGSSKPPFQIDATFGFTAAILEMLLFTGPGFLRVLPALPKAWQVGSIFGLRTRSDLICDIKWSQDQVEVGILSNKDQTVTIEFAYQVKHIDSTDCKIESVENKYNHLYCTVVLEKDKKALIKTDR